MTWKSLVVYVGWLRLGPVGEIVRIFIEAREKGK